jgi:hypothetical protein
LAHGTENWHWRQRPPVGRLPPRGEISCLPPWTLARYACIRCSPDAALERRYGETRRPARLAATRTVLAMAAVVWTVFALLNGTTIPIHPRAPYLREHKNIKTGLALIISFHRYDRCSVEPGGAVGRRGSVCAG